jgi:hypothetical protein
MLYWTCPELNLSFDGYHVHRLRNEKKKSAKNMSGFSAEEELLKFVAEQWLCVTHQPSIQPLSHSFVDDKN